MNVKIKPSKIEGCITPPPSKSDSHRLIIAAAMANGVSRISGISQCRDVIATVECLKRLGVTIEESQDDLIITGIDFRKAKPSDELFCDESGSTLRFLIPVASLCGKEVIFCGAERLFQRPIGIYESIFKDKGLKFAQENGKIFISGALTSGEYRVNAGISSQFISGLIFALCALDGESDIILEGKIESRSYINMTVATVKKFGARIDIQNDRIHIFGGGYHCSDATAERDFSAAAFMGALKELGAPIEINGLNYDSNQADKVFDEYFKKLKSGYAEIDIGNCPDLGPILFAFAAANHGGHFTSAARLKIKESDRAAAMAEELAKLGGVVNIEEDAVTVIKAPLTPPISPISAHNDHRIAMAMAILLTVFGGEIIGAEAVNKSYPEFWDDLSTLGVELEYYD